MRRVRPSTASSLTPYRRRHELALDADCALWVLDGGGRDRPGEHRRARPGETALVTAAVYAGATHNLNIAMVILAAITGAIVGDNIGFLVGRQFGYRLLLRHGSLFRLTTARIKLGQFLFLRHGGKMVFFGRFIAVLRALAALLAGVNCMAWPRFLIFNAAGGIVWAGGYGTLAYFSANAWSDSPGQSQLPLPSAPCSQE